MSKAYVQWHKTNQTIIINVTTYTVFNYDE